MATLVTRTVVCDIGMASCDNSTLVKVRVAVDGKAVSQLLCGKHAAPYVELQEQMRGKPKSSGRAKVFTPEEIKAQRKPQR